MPGCWWTSEPTTTERRLLIEGEHPAYHGALADPAFDGEIDGVNPLLHITIHEVVANQLWDNDPPEAWRAAKRLRDAGVDRHDILHQLGGVVTTHLHGVLSNRRPVDPAAYLQALDAVRPPASRRRAKSAAARAGDAVFQVKVTLRGVRPPIWRRLRLPAATTLAQLHQVMQVAFGGDNARGLPGTSGTTCCLHPPMTDSHTRRIGSRGPVRRPAAVSRHLPGQLLGGMGR